MGQQRCLFFVIVCSLIVNYSISEMLMRTSQAKFFPPDAEPPEETVELWMGRTGLPGTNNDVTSGSECDVDAWRRGDTGHSHLRALVAVLNCLRCQRPLAAGERVTDQCLQAFCDQKCEDSEEMEACREDCGHQQRQGDRSQGSTVAGRQRTDWGMRGEGEEGSQGEAGVDRQQLLTLQGVDSKRSASSSTSEYRTVTRDWGLSRAAMGQGSLFRRQPLHHVTQHMMNKRYRLGLYDCISSYCGKLSGPDRQLCIINYCHRSSTLKM